LRERDEEFAQKKATLMQSKKRIAEPDVLFKHIYEDNVPEKLSDESFIKCRTIMSLDKSTKNGG